MIKASDKVKQTTEKIELEKLVIDVPTTPKNTWKSEGKTFEEYLVTAAYNGELASEIKIQKVSGSDVSNELFEYTVTWQFTREGFMRQGINTQLIIAANEQFVERFGRPLYSTSKFLKIDEAAKAVWKHLESRGLAVKIDHYGTKRWAMY